MVLIAVGVVWAILATRLHLAVFGGLLPPPGDLPLPLAIAFVIVDLPLLAALSLVTGVGRPSPTFNEVIAVTIVTGVLLTLASAAITLGVRRAIT